MSQPPTVPATWWSRRLAHGSLARFVRWGHVLAPTNLHDPETGNPLYVWAKIRPAWYWTLRRWWLFASIVWREWEPGYRLSIKTAWSVACTVHPPNARSEGQP